MKTSFLALALLCLGAVATNAQAPLGDYRSATGANQVPATNLTIPPTAEVLQGTLYELIDQYHAVQQVHWDLNGPLFYALHDMLGEFYHEITPMIDDVAERKLALDRPADGRPGAVAGNARVAPPVPEGFIRDKDALELLAQRYKLISDRVGERIATTGDTDPVTQDLLISVRRMLDDHLWKIRSHMK